MNLSNQNKPNILLTGAAHGIGRATASALASRGFRLGLIDRAEEALAEFAGQLRASGGEVAAACADVRDGDGLKRAVASLESQIGPTDVVVACAGVGGLSSATDLDLEGFRQMLEVNVLGVART